jgi:hypothetical protein
LKPLLAASAAALCLTAGWARAACQPYVEEQPRWHTATLRPGREALASCAIGEDAYRVVVQGWLAARAADAAPLDALSLGRAVSMPWLSRALADAALASPGWAARAAHAKPGHRDALAAPILRDPALRDRLAVPFAGSRWTVTNVSYEKVLFGPAREHASHAAPAETDLLVPFDAQLWLRLVPRADSTAPEGGAAAPPPSDGERSADR